MKLLGRNLLRDVSGFILSGFVSNIVALLSSIFVIRELGPELRGTHVFIGLLSFFLIPLLNFGLTRGFAYQVSKKAHSVFSVTGTTVIVNFILGILVSVVVNLLSLWGLLGDVGSSLPFWFVMILSIIYPLNMVREALLSLIISDSKYWVSNKLAMANTVIQALIVYFFIVILKMKLLGILLSFVLGSVITFTLIVIVFAQLYSGFGYLMVFNKELLSLSWGYGRHAWIGTLSSQANNKADQFILNYFLSSSDLGLYSICGSFAQFIFFLPTAVKKIMYNRIADKNSNLNKESYTLKFLSVILIATFVLCTTLFIYIEGLILFLYGSAFVEISAAARIYIIGSGIYVVTMIMSVYFGATGRIKVNRNIQLFSMIFGALMVLIMVNIWGLKGVAFASTLTYILTALLFLSVFSRLGRRVKDSI